MNSQYQSCNSVNAKVYTLHERYTRTGVPKQRIEEDRYGIYMVCPFCATSLLLSFEEVAEEYSYRSKFPAVTDFDEVTAVFKYQ